MVLIPIPVVRYEYGRVGFLMSPSVYGMATLRANSKFPHIGQLPCFCLEH